MLRSSSGDGLVQLEDDLCHRLRQAGRQLAEHSSFEQWQEGYKFVDCVLLLDGGEDALPEKKRDRRSSKLERVPRARKIIRRTIAVLGEVDSMMRSAEESGKVGRAAKRKSSITWMHHVYGCSGIPEVFIEHMTEDVEDVINGTEIGEKCWGTSDEEEEEESEAEDE
jgi:hypothetical protein